MLPNTPIPNLSFGGYAGSKTLENFPVLVELGTHVNNFSYNSFITAEGGDLRFFDATSGSGSVGRELLTKWKNGTWMGNPMLGCKFPALPRYENHCSMG